MRATAEPVEGNKVRLSVEIDEPEVDQVLDETVRTIAQPGPDPGLPPGQGAAPGPRGSDGRGRRPAGRGAARGIPDFYAQALADAEVDPIAPPEIDITGWRGSRRGDLRRRGRGPPDRRHPRLRRLAGHRACPWSSTDAEVDAQVDRMRETEAELVEVSRPAIDGDNVTIDLHGDGER